MSNTRRLVVHQDERIVRSYYLEVPAAWSYDRVQEEFFNQNVAGEDKPINERYNVDLTMADIPPNVDMPAGSESLLVVLKEDEDE